MLIDRYLRRYLSRFPQSHYSRLSSLEMVQKLAVIQTLIFTSAVPFYEGLPLVTDFFAVQDQTFETRQTMLGIAGSLGAKSEVAFFKAVTLAAQQSGLILREVESDPLPLGGIIGKLERTWYVLGPESVMVAETVDLGVTGRTLMQRLESEGKEVLFLAQKQPKRLLGIMALELRLSAHSFHAIEAVSALGIKPLLVTGQKTRVAKSMALSLRIEHVHSELDEVEKRNLLASFSKTALNPAFVVTPATVPLVADQAVSFGVRGAPATLPIDTVDSIAPLIETSRMALRSAQRVFFWKHLTP